MQISFIRWGDGLVLDGSSFVLSAIFVLCTDWFCIWLVWLMVQYWRVKYLYRLGKSGWDDPTKYDPRLSWKTQHPSPAVPSLKDRIRNSCGRMLALLGFWFCIWGFQSNRGWLSPLGMGTLGRSLHIWITVVSIRIPYGATIYLKHYFRILPVVQIQKYTTSKYSKPTGQSAGIIVSRLDACNRSRKPPSSGSLRETWRSFHYGVDGHPTRSTPLTVGTSQTTVCTRSAEQLGCEKPNRRVLLSGRNQDAVCMQIQKRPIIMYGQIRVASTIDGLRR